MIHRIRTNFGDSNITYGGEDIRDWENKPQGILQGNTAGPDIWSALGSVISNVLHLPCFAESIVSDISKKVFTLVGFSYVDNCDLIQSGTSHIEVLASMQSLIDSWGSLMEVTGGAISTDKSWWYLIYYVWKRGKWIASDPQLNIDLIASDKNDDRISLSHLRSNEAAEVLGVWLAPNRNNKILSRC